MAAILFDTFRQSRALRDKGHFASEQAERRSEAFGEAFQDSLATKSDIAPVMRAIASLRSTTQAETSDLKAGLLKALIGATGFRTIVVVVAAIVLARIFSVKRRECRSPSKIEKVGCLPRSHHAVTVRPA